MDRSGEANPVHLAHEDLVAEQVAAPDAAVRVGKVVASLSGNVREVTQEGVGRVVLLADVIKMLCVFLDLVVTNHVLEQLELVVVLVVDGGGVEEYTNVSIVHLVITHHEKSRSVDASV